MSFVQRFTGRDLRFATLTGLISGFIGWRLFAALGVPEFQGIPWEALIIIVPILWVLGVLLGYFLGQWFEFFNQFGKFTAIGFTNAAVDFGVLNLLIAQTGFLEGKGYAGLKSISFIIALLMSYIWNKYWAFRSQNSRGGAGEFFRFFLVTVLSFGLNVSVAYFVATHMEPVLGLDARAWANVAAVAGSGIALVFSFMGFKKAVFKR